MSILDRYIARQILSITALGVMSLSALLLLGNLFKELRPLLVESQAPPSIIIEFVAQVVPFSLMFSIPWGFLTAVLLVYGRLSADNELTSMRMAGLSLWRLSMPAIVIAVLLSVFCYWINIDLAPRAKQSLTDIGIKAASSNPKGLLKEGQPITKFDDQEIYIDKRVGDTVYGMHIYQAATDTKPKASLHAKRVDVEFSEIDKILHLTLHDTFIEIHEKDGSLQAMQVEEMPWQIYTQKIPPRKKKPNRYTNSEIHQLLADPHNNLNEKQRSEFMTELPRRASFSIACIAFALIGVPLAINTRRKDTSSGFALGIIIAALYFVALVFADLSRRNGTWLPYILLWLPNVICFIVALRLHKKANRQG